MSSEVIVAIIALLGTIIGSLTGVLTANKLSLYRIEQLEKKVDKHNSLIDRTYKIEKDIVAIKVELDDIKHTVK